MAVEGLFSLPELVEWHAGRTPDRQAVDVVGGTVLSWSELNELGLCWAGVFRDLGVVAGDVVATMIPAEANALGTWLGASWLSAMEVPINHAFRGDWLSGLLGRLQPRVAVVHEKFLPYWLPVLEGSPVRRLVTLGGSSGELPAPGACTTERGEDLLAATTPRRPGYSPVLSDIACIMNTSGTTGVSKGVMLPWGTLLLRSKQGILPSTTRNAWSTYYAPFGPFHMTARRPWYDAARQGSRLVLRDGFKTDAWLEDIREHACNVTSVVAAMAQFLMNQPEMPDDADNPLQVTIMGPVLPNVDDFKRRFGVEVVTGFTMTEIPHTFLPIDGHVVCNETYRSCGKRDPQVPLRLVTADGRDADVLEVGELWVSGDPVTLNSGYYRQPEATAAAWTDGWFHTGDLFRYDEEGRYYFLDRAKDALRRRGENISSYEIEGVVCRHPDVLECAAVGVPSQFTEDEIKVCVVKRPGQSLDHQELIDFISPLMAEFAIPRYIQFVDELPKTPTLKVQKSELRRLGLAEVAEGTWDRLAADVRRVPRAGKLSSSGRE